MYQDRLRNDIDDRPAKFKYGNVVRSTVTDLYGHIIGFKRVETDGVHFTLLKVLWEDGEVRAIQPDSVIVFMVEE